MLKNLLRPVYFFVILLASLTLVSLTSFAEDPSPQQPQQTAEQFLASLNMQTGKINLPGDIATLSLSDRFRYLSPKDAEKLLVDAWGNPPGSKSLGMILPADVSPLSQEGWGVVITYDEDGFVKDDDADKINYADLLKDMKEQNKSASEEREKAGYGPMLLVGWAESPRYDKQARKLYWAKEYSTKAPENSLNYDIRVLGRKGVLVLSAVAGMNQLQQIKQEMPEVISMAEFTKGNRYEDFDSSTDHYAEYGLAALVAGGVAAKLGFFAKFFGLLLVLKKFIIIGLVAIGGFFAKLFGRKKSDDSTPKSDESITKSDESTPKSE